MRHPACKDKERTRHNMQRKAVSRVHGRQGSTPLGKLLRPSLGLTASGEQSGTPVMSYCGGPSGQQRAAKLGRGRPTWRMHGCASRA